MEIVMSFRKEKKFRMSYSDLALAKTKLLEMGMTKLHPNRVITSQYFDTRCLKMFSESEEGLLPRKKIRVRWYNSELKNLTLEEKTSSIEGRFKETFPISCDNYEKSLKTGLSNSMYGVIFPSAKVSYKREYYIYKKMRFTFDSNITYKHFSSSRVIRDFDRVLEIKSPIDASDDFLEKIFPYPTTRFSKYCRAFLLKDRIL